MRFTLSLLLLFFGQGLFAQSNEEDYRVICTIIDTLNANCNFDYYYPEPKNESCNSFRNEPDSIFTLIDPETYYDISKTGFEWDSIYTKEYLAEMELFALRSKSDLPIIFIGSMHEDNLPKPNWIRDSIFNASAKSVGIDMYKLKPLDLEIDSLNNCGNFTFKSSTKENTETYKYVFKAYFAFSNVVYNVDKTYAVIEVGCHYRIHNGKTGFGELLLLKKTNNNWSFINGSLVWEE